MLVASMALVVTYTDIFMIGYLNDETGVGIYDIAIKFSSIPLIFLSAINAYVMPKFAELFGNEDMSGLRKVIQESSTLIFWTSVPILVVSLILSALMMEFYGDEYSIGIPALRLLLLSQFVSAICGAVGHILQMTNNQVIFQNIFLVATLINVVLNFILIPKYGITGAATASLISTATWNIASVIVVKKRIGVLTLYNPFKFKIGANR
jgi:O-antigen/teichoic acid export membrane protein